jgi:hypothetical protein
MGSSLLINNPTDVDREMIKDLLAMTPGEWDHLNSDFTFRASLAASCDELVAAAYGNGDPVALARIHDALALVYDQDFRVTELDRVGCESQPILRDIAARLERAMLDSEVGLVPDGLVTGWPTDGREFVRWLKAIIVNHPASRHRLYQNFLKDDATVDDFRFFMAQETNLDPRFDDILALMQVGTDGAEKMEIAGNYWDEMGNGTSGDVHTAMFAETLTAIGVDQDYVAANLLSEARISGNLSAALSLSRRHYYKAVGFFAVTEYLVPRRFKCLTEGWRRNSLPEPGIRYHDLHIGIDAVHASGWFKNVVAPIVEKNPETGREIANGAMMRLSSSLRYMDALMEHFDSRA